MLYDAHQPQEGHADASIPSLWDCPFLRYQREIPGRLHTAGLQVGSSHWPGGIPSCQEAWIYTAKPAGCTYGLQETGVPITGPVHHGICFSDMGPIHESQLGQTGMNPAPGIQRQAAPWAYSEYSPKTSVTALLGKLQWEPLQEPRRIQRLVFLYKILNGKVAVPADTVDLVLNPRPTRGTSANQQSLAIQHARTVEFKNSFSLRTVPDWNKVSQTIVSAESVASFQTRLTGQVP